jgi:hypothetical protein
MRQLKSTSTTPPGGWRYVDPDTRFVFDRDYRFLNDLLEHIKTFRAQNRLEPIPDLQMVVEEWLCHQPNMKGYYKEVPNPRTMSQYLRGTRAIARTLARSALRLSESYCPPEEAEARAAICEQCFHNDIPHEQSALAAMADTAIQELVGDRSTSKDRKLFTCLVCTCPLRAKVHFSNSLIQEDISETERYRYPNGLPGRDGKPVYCWQRKPLSKT